MQAGPHTSLSFAWTQPRTTTGSLFCLHTPPSFNCTMLWIQRQGWYNWGLIHWLLSLHGGRGKMDWPIVR